MVLNSTYREGDRFSESFGFQPAQVLKPDSFSKDFKTPWNGSVEWQHEELSMVTSSGGVPTHLASNMPWEWSCPTQHSPKLSKPSPGRVLNHGELCWFEVPGVQLPLLRLKLGVQYPGICPEPTWRAQMRQKHSGPLHCLSFPSNGAAEG